jgi:hypothetical protein
MLNGDDLQAVVERGRAALEEHHPEELWETWGIEPSAAQDMIIKGVRSIAAAYEIPYDEKVANGVMQSFVTAFTLGCMVMMEIEMRRQ